MVCLCGAGMTQWVRLILLHSCFAPSGRAAKNRHHTKESFYFALALIGPAGGALKSHIQAGIDLHNLADH